MAEAGVALVTGASSGFGRGIVLELARAEYFVFAAVRDLTKVEACRTEAKLQGLADRIAWIELDVTREDHVKRAVKDISGMHGRLDVLVNNAGIAIGGMAEEIGIEAWRQQLETNVYGVIRVTQAVLPMMRAQRSGKIIQISSLSGRFGFPGLAPYVTSKFALEGFSESLRLELLPLGIHVVLVEPGAYRTDIWGKSMAMLHRDDEAGPSAYGDLRRRIVRLTQASSAGAGDPAEVCRLVLRIVRMRAPRLRYPIGRGARTMPLAKALLPWSWIERLVMKQVNKDS